MTAIDEFETVKAARLTFPVERSFVCVFSDAEELPHVTRQIHANGTGTILVQMAGDSAVVPIYVVAGMSYARRIRRIAATGSDAIEIVGDY